MGSTLVTPLYELYRKHFGFSVIVLTLIYAVYVVGNVLALLFFGRVSDQAGRRRVAMVAIGLAAAGAVVFLFAQSTVWLFIARALLGLAVGIASGTGAAWIAELYGSDSTSRATIATIAGNFTGIGVGPLIAGILAAYAPGALQLPFVFYLVALGATGVLVACCAPETVNSKLRSLRELQVRPRIGVPERIRGQFIAPALTVFASFALGGFYFALLPRMVNQTLRIPNVAVGGAIVFELGITLVVCSLATQNIERQRAMVAGLFGLIPSAALLILAQALHSLPLLLAASAITGCAMALSYRGSLQVVNAIAPAQQRAEVVSCYFIAGFTGNSIPVIGLGVISTFSNALIANSALAIVVVGFAVVALMAQKRYPSTRVLRRAA